VTCGGFGEKPIEDEPLYLTDGQDFYHVRYLGRNLGDWPAETAAQIVIATPSPTTWDATVADNELRFYAPKAEVTAALIPHGTPWEMFVTIPAEAPTPELTHKLYRGTVVRSPVRG
jgi:hypothetical protein